VGLERVGGVGGWELTLWIVRGHTSHLRKVSQCMHSLGDTLALGLTLRWLGGLQAFGHLQDTPKTGDWRSKDQYLCFRARYWSR
jgi:hypothetical protein